MENTISIDDLRQRRQELLELIAQETEQARRCDGERHAANAAAWAARLHELDRMIIRCRKKHDPEHLCQLCWHPIRSPRSNAFQRYRKPGVTTDIVAYLYRVPGTPIQDVTTAIFKKRKYHGTTRDTVAKLVRRLIGEGFARRDGSRLYLNEQAKVAWEASPLYCLSTIG